MDNPLPNPSQNAPPVGSSQSGVARCAVHPNVTATFCCHDCGRTLCDTCGFSEEDGNIVCTECVARRRPPPAVDVPELDLGPIDPALAQKMAEKSDHALLDMFESPDDWREESLNAARVELHKRSVALPSRGEVVRPTIPKSPPVRDGVMCVQHPKVQAVQQCRKCGSFMCATCDFAFPGDVHFCPTCVSRGDEALSGKRKKFMIGSFVLAAWSTVGMTCLVSGAMRGMARTEDDRVALGWVLIIFVLGPAIAGLSLGVTARRKQASNPATLWIAIIWNAVLVASFVVLTLIGLSRQ